MDVINIINEYSNRGIFIEILADGYKLENVGICWRGYFYYKNDDGDWIDVECGCFPDWMKAFEDIIINIEKNQI